MAWNIKLFNQQLFFRFTEQTQNLCWLMDTNSLCIRKANYSKFIITAVSANFKGLSTLCPRWKSIPIKLCTCNSSQNVSIFLKHPRVLIYQLSNLLSIKLFFSPSPSLTQMFGFTRQQQNLTLCSVSARVSIAMIHNMAKGKVKRKGFIWLVHPYHSSPKEVRAGTLTNS